MSEQTEHVEGRSERRAALHHLTKTDPDPRVRRRAQALLLVEDGHSQASAARLLQTSASRVHIWQERFATEGRAGLVDRPRGGRPHALSDGDRAFLEEALARGPQAYDLPMTVWSIRDLQALLAHERGVVVSVDTVHRVVHTLGFRSRRPRHDLTHRQDRAAVAAAHHVLEWLPKKQLLSPVDSIWSTGTSGTSVKSIPTRTWQRSGSARDSP
ncbi:MAG TPA: IS630 family transposase [Ktedonobacterales bacterium]|nr:IS630 family transposase [Ktedonobacterales bacterium]